MNVEELNWPDLPTVSVGSPDQQEGRHDQEPSVTRYKRQHRALLDAVGRLLGEQGYEKTTVAQVVADAKMSKRTFYEHFESREACLIELLQRVCLSMARNLIRTAEEHSDSEPLEMVSALLGTEVATMRTGSQLAGALFGVSRMGISQRLAIADYEAQSLFGRIFAVAAIRMGSELPFDQLEMTACQLNYALGVRVHLSPKVKLDLPAIAVMWCQALGLSEAFRSVSST